MLDATLPSQLKIGKQKIRISDLLNATVSSVSLNNGQKISKFLYLLATDILCMRDDALTEMSIRISNNTFIISMDESYPFLDFLKDGSIRDRLFVGPPQPNTTIALVEFDLNLATPIDMIGGHLIAIILDDLKKHGIYKFTPSDENNSMEPIIHIEALNALYTFDVIDIAMGYGGRLSSMVRGREYNVLCYIDEADFSIFEFRSFNTNKLELTLSNHDFYIKVGNNSVQFEYLYDSMTFHLNHEHPLDFNVDKFTKFFLSFYNVQHDTTHDDLPRWITLQEMVAI